MEEFTNCPNCDTFIGSIGDLDVCPVCGCSLIGDEHGDWYKEENTGETSV